MVLRFQISAISGFRWLMTGLALSVAVSMSVLSPARAQEEPVAESIPAQEQADDGNRQREELQNLEADLAAREERRKALQAEIASLSADRAELNRVLLETTDRIRGAEDRVTALEQRLLTLDGSEQAIRRSLESRRDVIAEVLAALQRMGRSPPPAVIVEPEDVLLALRSAILLGAVVPDLREEAEALASDLTELARLRQTIATDREALKKDIETLQGEQERLAALIEERQRRIGEAEKSDADEGARVAELADRSRNLKDLIARMEMEITASRRAAEEAQEAERAREKGVEQRLAAEPFGDNARLEPKVSFAKALGLLPYPVRGDIVRRFGEPDGFGGRMEGMAMSTREESVISSPTDGWVVYSGPFRSFGQLLIINAGDGYYVLLAGMERINVALGQFVLTGEPVGLMGKALPSGVNALAPGALAGGANGPVLYVEFRKDGGSIDPSPWWAKTKGEKVRG